MIRKRETRMVTIRKKETMVETVKVNGEKEENVVGRRAERNMDRTEETRAA